MGIAFIVALFASTVVALTLTPVLCSYLLGNKGKDCPKEGICGRMDEKALPRNALLWSLNHKSAVLGWLRQLFAVALVMFFTLGRSFLPSFNEGSFTINISSLPGISTTTTTAGSDKWDTVTEELLMSIPEIQTVARKRDVPNWMSMHWG